MSPRGEQIWGIVLAAGSGLRFGGPKHQVKLAGKALWEWARDALLDSGANRVVVVGPVPGGVEGGPERAHFGSPRPGQGGPGGYGRGRPRCRPASRFGRDDLPDVRDVAREPGGMV